MPWITVIWVGIIAWALTCWGQARIAYTMAEHWSQQMVAQERRIQALEPKPEKPERRKWTRPRWWRQGD